MISWITEKLGTASYYYYEQAGDDAPDAVLVDVRELTDKEGNADDALRGQIQTGVDALRDGRRVVVCCDIGISRSNAVAVGVLMGTGLSYEEATRTLSGKANVSEINLALLRQVRALFEGEQKEERATAVPTNLFVTGASGYVGSALLNALEGSEYKVSCHSRDELDLARDTVQLDSYVSRNEIDFIVHLAHPRARNNMSAMGEGLAMIKSVLEVCRLNGLGLLYLSSLAVYSGHHSDSVLKTSAQLKTWPRGSYGETKFLCEELIKLYQTNYGLSATVLRPAAVYGARMPKSSFFAKFFATAMRGETIRTHRYLNGAPTFDFLHLNDLLKAIRRALRCAAPDAPVHLGTGTATSTFELARMISAITGQGSKVEMVDINDKTYKVIVDPSEAKAELGWEAGIDLETGLDGMLREYTQNEDDARASASQR